MDQAMRKQTTEIAYNELNEKQLDIHERQIAGRYMHDLPWSAVAWGLGNLAIWLSLWPLVVMGIMPLWLAFPVATMSVTLAYLPSHEAQHGIIAREGRPLRWLNELVGHLSLIPLAQPFRVMRHTHFEHHAHTNDPTLDPDYAVHAESTLAFWKKSILKRQPGSNDNDAYAAALVRTGNSHLLADALVYRLVYIGVLFGFAWSGFALEVALLWWIPIHIGSSIIQYYLSWAPHHPGVEQGRYKDTRAFKSRLGNLGSMGMQYHIIHHLYPRIPLAKTPAAFRELKPILARKGCDLGRL